MHVQSYEQKNHLSKYLGTTRPREQKKKETKDRQELPANVKQFYLTNALRAIFTTFCIARGCIL